MRSIYILSCILHNLKHENSHLPLLQKTLHIMMTYMLNDVYSYHLYNFECSNSCIYYKHICQYIIRVVSLQETLVLFLYGNKCNVLF